MAVLFLVATVPSATSQIPLLPESPQVPPLPIDPDADHAVVSLDVPLAGAAGSGSLQVPVDEGILDIRVDPILLPGPGGTVDVEAYLATVRLLLPSGAILPLPSMVIRSEDQAIEGPAAQALAELAASAEALRLELEALADEVTAPSDPPAEPAPAEEPDPVADAIAALEAQANALAAEAAWVQAMADEAAGAAGAGAAEQAAIAGAMLARVEAGLALLQKGLDAFEAEASALAEEARAAAPEAPEAPAMPTPSGSSESASSSTGPASPTPTPSPSMPATPDLSRKMEKVGLAVSDAQAQADRTAAKAQAARDELAAKVGALGGNLVARADALVDEQTAIDGARAAAALTLQALADRQAGALAMLAELRAELEASAEGQSQGPRDAADAAAANAQAVLDEAVGRTQWARDWVAEAQAMAGSSGGGTLDDASRSLASAQRSVEAVAAIADRYVSSQSPVQAGQLADQLADAQQQLDGAIGQVEAAQADLAAELEAIAAQDPTGGLDPIPGAGSLPGPPGAPEVPALPGTPGSPGSPVSFDAEALAVCMDSLASQACFHYRSPFASPPGSLRVLVALPGPGAIDDLASVPVDPGADLPSDPVPPLPTGLPGLPGASGSSSSSTAASSSQDPGTTPSTSAGPGLLPDDQPSSSTGASPAPHLQAQADRDTLGIRMGEQDTIVVTVRNDGTAADLVGLTAQTDAPIAFDTTDEPVMLAPGQEHDFVVRITPLAAGSGTIDLLATGETAGTVLDSVLVAVQAAPSRPAAIAASLDPTAVQAAVGQATAVTIRLANEGEVEDVVFVEVSGQDMLVEPSLIEVLLQPGEAAARQVWITPTSEGASKVVLSITSDRGADLQPMVTMDAVGSAMSVGDEAPSGGSALDDSKDSPGAGILVSAAAIGLAMLARRKLRKA